MRRALLGVFAVYVFSFALVQIRAEADGICTAATYPTPIPAGVNGITVPLCSAFGGATPAPAPTQPYQVNVVNTPGVVIQNTSIPITAATTIPVSGSFPTPLAIQPVSLPTSFQTAFPTPIPFPTLGVDVLNTPTVNAGTGFPTPLAVQPVSGTVTANAGTGFSTPIPYATSAGTVLKVDGSAVTQPVSGTLTVNTPPPTTTVTVTQATGTNLHAVLDTTSTTAVTQATGTNLHAVLDSGTTTVTQGTGTNLHTVVDSGTVSANAGTGTFTVGQSVGTNLHAILDANTGVVIGKVSTDQTTPGTTDLVHSKICDTTTPTTCAPVSATTGLTVRAAPPLTGLILTSASATACTNVQAVAGNGFELINSGPATTVFLQIYNDAASTCAAGTLLYGDGSTIVIGAGQVIKVDYPVAGIAYKLSGALTANLSVTGL